jgi:hypothetical protein
VVEENAALSRVVRARGPRPNPPQLLREACQVAELVGPGSQGPRFGPHLTQDLSHDRDDAIGAWQIAAASRPARTIPQRAVVELPESDYDRWDRFVASSANGSIFHTVWWQRAWGLEPTVRVLMGGDGEIQAGICCCIGRLFGTRAMIKPPMTCFNGPVYSPIQKRSRHGHGTRLKHTLLAILHGLPRLGMYDLQLTYSDSDVMPFLWNGFDSLVEYSYVIPFSEKETWIRETSKTRRWTLRKAYKDASDLHYSIDDHPDFSEVCLSWRRPQRLSAIRLPTTPAACLTGGRL